MKEIKNWDEVPEFATEDEEREFWETHSISPDLAEDFDRPAQGPMARRLQEVRQISPDLDDETFRRLMQLSLLEQTHPKALISRFIADGLREEEKRIGLADRN